MVSFGVQKILSSIRSHLLIFAFIFIIVEDESKYITVIYVKEYSSSIFF